jgi:hypothetical protein
MSEPNRLLKALEEVRSGLQVVLGDVMYGVVKATFRHTLGWLLACVIVEYIAKAGSWLLPTQKPLFESVESYSVVMLGLAVLVIWVLTLYALIKRGSDDL